MRTTSSWVALLAVSLSVLPGSLGAQRPAGTVTIDRIAEIKFPRNPAWSPDGRRVAFIWDHAGDEDLFVVTAGQEPVALTDFAVDPETLTSDLGAIAWASDDQILFSQGGRLWSVSVGEGVPRPVEALPQAGSFALSGDRERIAVVRGGQVWVASLGAWTMRQLTFLAGELGASAPVFSRDDRHVAFVASRRWTVEEELPYNGDLVRTFDDVSADQRLGVVSVHGGDPVWIPTTGDVASVQWTADGEVLYEETSPDRKTREIKVATPGGEIRTLWRDHDPAWWSPTGRDSRTVVSPDGRSVAFVSDRTGWTHVWVTAVDAASGSEARQLTSGAFGAGLPAWSPDSRRIAYQQSVEGNQMERFIHVVDVASGQGTPVVTRRGVSIDPTFSPDGSSILFERTDVENSKDLYVVEARAGGEVRRLSNSMPPGLDPADLTTPVPVEFPSRVDGQGVPATLMVHEDLDLDRRHPAIVWIHGSGSDQNYLGWHPAAYRMYYSMHQYLAQQGYIILTPDYRGSSGYHRDWTTGHYMDLGGVDYLDVASGADYLKTLDYVDPDRIGVWGLSYGGFMTLQAVTVTPTLFRAAINVAGVGDWATWSTSGWITGRMGTPVENPDGFHRSAPVKHMEKLERPLMVMHGTFDSNVAFRESLTLIDRLVKLGKDFETVVYPGETHFFRRAHVLRDAWRRAERFFDQHLRDGRTAMGTNR